MSTTAITAQGSTVQLSSTAGSGKTISAVALGYPTILTCTAHGLVRGDVVTIAGMTGADAAATVNGNSYVIKNVLTDKFAIDVDTTGKTITAAGTATPVSWTTISGVQSIKPGEPKVDDIDSTDLSSTVKEYRPGLADYADMTLEILYIPADAGQQALYSDFAAKNNRYIKHTIPNGETITYYGYINKCGLPDGAVSQVSKFSVSLRNIALPTRA